MMQPLVSEPLLTTQAVEHQWAFFPRVHLTKFPAITKWQHVTPGMYPFNEDSAINLPAEVLVIDYDPRKESDEQRGSGLAEITARFPELSSSFTVRTPSGGCHIYLRKPPNLRVRKKQTLFPAFDFLSQGHYVVAPYSVTSAGQYTVSLNVPYLSDVPTNLVELLQTEQTEQNRVEITSLALEDEFRLECQTAAPAVEGQGGDHATFVLACRGRDAGLPMELVYQHMRDEWNPQCIPPWNETDLFAKVQNAFKYGKNSAGNRAPEAIFTPPEIEDLQVGVEGSPQVDEAQPKKAGVVEQLLACAANFSLWHDERGIAYATILRDGHAEHYAIQSAAFYRLFEYACFKQTKKVPSEQSIKNAIRNLDVRARHEGEKHSSWLRVAEHDNKIYIDLCDESWRCVEISPVGITVLADPPVRFLRNDNMQPLPEPDFSDMQAALNEFRAMIRLVDSKSWPLLLMFLLSCLKRNIDFPIALILGPQRVGKSGLMRFMRDLVDPNVDVHRDPPQEAKQVVIAANTNRVPSWDNASHLDKHIQDALCRLSTGGSVGERKYYTNFDEVSISAMAPAIINGISLGVLKSDLLDRSLAISMGKPSGSVDIDREERQDQFTVLKPRLFGALCNAVRLALERYDQIKPSWTPRLSGAYKWVLAAAPALGLTEAEIERACRENEREAAEAGLEASPFIQHICRLMDSIPDHIASLETLPASSRPKWPRYEFDANSGISVWEGNPDLLLQGARQSRGNEHMLPKSAKTVYDSMMRYKDALELAGITFERRPPRGDCRPLRIQKRHSTLTFEDLL